ncbi:MAG: ATP-binding protein [Parabacteroides sp.]|nr:ATP-binding protein [Parabacteroides sp.]
MLNMNNPFLIVGYQGPEYFCDREKETEVILSALHNGRNITLVSPRRMGKTGLIKNVFYIVQEKEINAKCFYLDIFSTQSLREFVALLGREILGKLDTFSQSTLKTLLSFFKSCRPVITMDELSGIPSISLDIVPSKEEETLKEIFDYLRQSGKECYLAIDEFQQIMEYPEKGVEGLLRSYIQFLPNVHFIFSGSKKHLMEYIFFSIKRPFYQSTQKLFLDKISEEMYFSFARSFFEKEGKVLPDEIFDKIYTWVDGHTWYVQYFLNRLFALPGKTLSMELLDSLLMEILQEEEYTFQTYFQLLTFNQIQLLKAIAKEGIVREVNASVFIKKYDLKAVSSVNTSLKILMDKEFILKQPDGYIIYDRFMSIWLSRL